METDGDLRLTRIRGRIKAWLSQTDAGVRHQVLREWIDGDNFLDGIILLQRELLLPIGFKKNLPMPYLESRGLSEEDVRLAEANVERILRPLLDETAQELRTAGRLSGDDPNESTVKRRGAKDDSQETQRTYVQTGRPDLTAKALGPAALAPAATAIIAWHGMGQQLPFETVETVARALAKDQARQTGGSEPIVTTRLVQLGTQQLWRAELDVTAAGSAHHVHIYEAYWAPLTQGKISTGETVKFLLGAAYHGIRYCAARPPLFLRYLFGRWVKFRLKPSLALVFVGLVVTLLSLVAMNFAITTAVSVKLLTGGGGPGGWPSHSLLADLTIDFGWLELVLGSLLLAFTKAYWSQKKYRREARSSKRHGVIRWLMWALIGLAVAVTLVVALLVAAHLVIHRTPVPMWWPIPHWIQDVVRATRRSRRDWLMLAAGGAAILGIWTTAIIVSAVIRWFLLEFAGDVAIYVSSHKLNRFYETRQAIKAACFTSAEAVYRFGGYGQHIVMGHSLGSLVAYDTLNRLINEDLLNGGLNVRPRTRLLLTFGSPLDKVAFLFRAQSEFSDVREALASTTQPLISNPAMRPPWINISSPEDIISGKLDYYDPEYGHTGPSAQARAGVEPSELTPPPPIFNVVDPDAWIPLIAHTQYWTNAKLIEVLMDAIQTPETHA